MTKFNFWDDASKRAFVWPKMLLDMTGMWPTTYAWYTKYIFITEITCLMLFEIVQFIYVVYNFNDIAKITTSISTLSTGLQSFVKLTVMFMNSRRLKIITLAVWKDFWPSDLMGSKLEKSLNFTSSIVITNMLSVLIAGTVFAFGFSTKALIDGNRILPFHAWFPFNWENSPIYEIIYLWQSFSNNYLSVCSILGHDFFFLALCSNLIAQFRLLKKTMENLGSGSNRKINEILDSFPGVEKVNGIYEEVEEEVLLVKCVQHHEKLLNICDAMESIFSPSLFIQLASSAAAICVSSFLITVMEIDAVQFYNLTSYCLGHVLQLFIICAAGNELSYQSESLGNYAFYSKWYSKEYRNLRRGLIMVIARCRRICKVSALGIMDMNYQTFVKVMRLSFSFYTLLSNMLEKKKQ